MSSSAGHVDGKYDYNPSFAAAVAFSALYGIASVIYFTQFVMHKSWFLWPLMVGVWLELVGYVSRADSVKHVDESSPFVLSTISLLVAPAVMAASCYQIFSRIIIWVVPPEYHSMRYLWVPATRVTPVFVGCDILSFLVQAAGGAIFASADSASSVNTGHDLIIVGLAIQLFTFGFFLLSVARFYMLERTHLHHVALPDERNWRAMLVVVNVSGVLIWLRSVYRIVEYALGNGNYLQDNEWPMYVLDAVPIFICVVLFMIVHPGMILPYLGIRRRDYRFSARKDVGICKNLVQASGNQGWRGEAAASAAKAVV